MPTEFAVVYEAAKNVTVVSLLIFFIVGGVKKWWVFGWVYEASEAERRELKSIVYRTLDVAQEAAAKIPQQSGRRMS
jgi:hypothetical protein